MCPGTRSCSNGCCHPASGYAGGPRPVIRVLHRRLALPLHTFKEEVVQYPGMVSTRSDEMNFRAVAPSGVVDHLIAAVDVFRSLAGSGLAAEARARSHRALASANWQASFGGSDYPNRPLRLLSRERCRRATPARRGAHSVALYLRHV